MTPADFLAWRQHMARLRKKDRPISERETAALLGCSRVAVKAWSTSRNPPLYVALACAAIALGLSSYQGPQSWT